jgi:hypothetical protein
MHQIKENVILRILVPKSPESELLLKRYEGLKFHGLNFKFGKFGRLLYKKADLNLFITRN